MNEFASGVKIGERTTQSVANVAEACPNPMCRAILYCRIAEAAANGSVERRTTVKEKPKSLISRAAQYACAPSIAPAQPTYVSFPVSANLLASQVYAQSSFKANSRDGLTNSADSSTKAAHSPSNRSCRALSMSLLCIATHNPCFVTNMPFHPLVNKPGKSPFQLCVLALRCTPWSETNQSSHWLPFDDKSFPSIRQ